MNQPDHIEEHLLLDYLLGNLDAEQRQRVNEWLTRSEANRKLLDRLEVLWLETGKLDPPPVAVDTLAAWKRISARIEAAGHREKGTGIIPMPLLRWTAGIAAMLLISFGIWWLADSGKQELQVVASMEEVVRDTLPDGSAITLNKNTHLAFPAAFEEGTREVSLLGEAFFEVEPDPGKPFIVQAGAAGIWVLGTSFDVRAYPGQAVEVTVLTGTVRFFAVDPVNRDSASILLTKGMKGILHPGSTAPEIDLRSIPDDLFWLNRTLQFRETPLSEVIRLLEDRYHATILLADETIGGCRLTATFSGEPIEMILRVITDTFALDLESENGTFIISGNGCVETSK